MKYEGVHIECGDDHLKTYITLFSLLYANDTIIMGETPENLQKALDALHEYCEEWKL